MPSCYLKFHSQNTLFHEDHLIDGMALLWHLLSLNVDEFRELTSEINRLSTLWTDRIAELGGMGILSVPFEDWLSSHDEAKKFAHILEKGIEEILRIGITIPVPLMRSVVSEPGRFSRDPPSAVYADTIRKLKDLIVNGAGKMSSL